MTTKSNAPSQSQLQEATVKPSPQNMAEVTNTEKDQMADKTIKTTSNGTEITAKKIVNAAGDTSTKKEDTKDLEKVPTSTKKSWLLENSKTLSNYIHINFPALEVFYEEKMRSHVDFLIARTPVYYEKYVKPNEANLQLVHSVCMIFWGGSWYSFALLLSFFNVYIENYTNEILNLNAVEKYLQKIWDFSFDKFSVHSKMFEMKIVKSAHEIWVLFVIFYAVWTVSFLASLTMTLATLKLVANTMISREMTVYFEKNILNLSTSARWLRYAVFIMSALVFVLLPINIQACILMSCLGYQKLISVMSDGFKENVFSIKGPNNIDGIIITSWIIVAMSIILQFFCRFQSSLFGFMVPLGFYIPRETNLAVKKEE